LLKTAWSPLIDVRPAVPPEGAAILTEAASNAGAAPGDCANAPPRAIQLRLKSASLRIGDISLEVLTHASLAACIP
jgi:hypothetical protein